MSRWSSYRRSLILSMGLTPLVLAGCDGTERSTFADGDDAATLHELPASDLAPPITLTGDAPVTGVYLSFTATGLTPGARAWLTGSRRTGAGICPPLLGGLCLDIVNATILDTTIANANGVATFETEIPYDTPDGQPVALQAVTAGATSNALQGTTSHAPRTCGQAEFVDPTNWRQLNQGLVCRPLPRNGSCEAASDLAYRETVDMLEDAIQRPATQGPWFVDFYATCNEDSIETACCYRGWLEVGIVGRPYSVDGTSRMAAPGPMADWASPCEVDRGALSAEARHHLARCWVEAARGEHASVASFARFALHLAQLGAPAALMVDTTRAMADEIRHARDAFGIARSFDAEVHGPGPMDTTSPSMDTEAIVLAAVREGCIAETIAAAQASAAADVCRDEELRNTLRAVAEDEQRHAALAWRFVRWALQTHPELRHQVRAAFAEAPAFPSARATALDGVERAWGVLPEVDKVKVAREVWRDVVQPCSAQLFGERERVDIAIC